MSVFEITDKEAKIILVIYSKLKYNNHEDVVRVCNYLKENDSLQTESARAVLKELEDYRDTKIPGMTCAICGKELGDREHLICGDCRVTLQKIVRKKISKVKANKVEVDIPGRLEGEEKDEEKVASTFLPKIKEKTISVFSKLVKQLKKPKVLIATGVTLASVIIIITAALMIKRAGDVSGKIYREFAESIHEKGYFIGNEYTPEDGSISYEILPTYESLLIFNDEKGKFTGAALAMKGSDEVSRSRQAIFISSLNMAIYKDITESDAMSMVSLIAYNGGLLDFRGYQCVLILGDEISYYYILDESKIDVNSLVASKEQDSMKLAGTEQINSENIQLDAVALMGKSQKVCEEVFGEGEQIVMPNTLYYPNVCMSIFFDEESEEIIYVDVDGIGEQGTIYVAGLYIGEKLKDATKSLDDQNISYEIDEDILVSYIGYGDVKMRLEANISGDKISLLSITKER